MASQRVDAEQFIETVREYPFLYNKREKDFKNISRNEACWREIGLKFGLSGVAAPKKWKNLRDRYIKQKNAVQKGKVTGTGVAEVPKISWAYYAIMDSVVRSTLNENSSVINVMAPVPADVQMSDFSNTPEAIALPNDDTVEDPSELGFDTQLADEAEDGGETLDISSPCSTVSGRNLNTTDICVHSHSQPPKSRKRRHVEIGNEEIAQAVLASAEVLKTYASSQQQPIKQVDTVSSFAMNVECRLRSLSKKKQLHVMHEFENILFQAEMDELEDA